MTDKKHDLIDQKLQDLNNDGIDRRGFLKCMAWAGTGLVWTMQRRDPDVSGFRQDAGRIHTRSGDFSFVQISDSHMGFNKPANPDVVGTLQAAIDKINALPTHAGIPAAYRRHQPSLEAGRVRHRRQILKSASAKDVFFVPGEHDVLDDDGKSVSGALRKGTQGSWMVQLR